jgi:predicted RecA/RadA family phage recombinase
MKNAHQDGRVLDVTLTAAVESGGVVTKGRMLGVAVTNGAIGATIAVHVEGVFRLPKLGTAVIAVGEPVTWDVSAGHVIVAGAAVPDVEHFGYAVEAAGNGAEDVLVRLCPGVGIPKVA